MRALGPPVRLSVAGLVEVLARRLDADSPETTLFRLFWLGVPVARAHVEHALAPIALDELAAANLISIAGDEVQPRVGITPYRGLLFVHDPGRRLSDQAPDFVTSVNASSCLLDWLTIRCDVSSALDLGSGCGVQALLAARHVGAVTAVDVNPRAVEYTALNALLNGAANVEALQGSWFEPVAGRRFGLVVANLPFVISPDASYTYRDSGLPADAASRMVVETIADHLEEGGFAHVFCNWVVPAGGDWREPIEQVAGGTGCDAVLLLHGRHDPLSYAARWNHPVDEEDPARFAETIARWLDYYRREGIQEIADGMVLLRRRSQRPNFVRALEVPGAPTRPAGEHLLRLFEGYDLVRALSTPTAVLDLALALADGATIDQRSVSLGGRARAANVRIGLQANAGFSVSVEPAVAAVLARCDGRTPLRELLEPAATAPAGDVASEARRLLSLGFLVPAAPAG